MYDEPVPASYIKFRENWILLRRTHPKVPCPENTPLPNRRISKEERAKRLCIYLMPWTLSKKMSKERLNETCKNDVPYLADLIGDRLVEDTSPGDAPTDVLPSSGTFRQTWKKYMAALLPHSERGVRSFLLTCVAEGRGSNEDDETRNRAKGPVVLCDLTIAQIHEAVSADNAENKDKKSAIAQQVQETARRAMELGTTQTATQVVGAADFTCVINRQLKVPAKPKPENKDPSIDQVCSSVTATSLRQCTERYERWYQDVFGDEGHPKLVAPTNEQAKVLRLVHDRVTQEEYELAGEPLPAGLRQVEKPLLRLVHGLPGSGKSKLIEWLTMYFEYVWEWKMNKQYALVAPMNTMADNIGGNTIHSFGNISFKDRKGIEIKPQTNKEDGGINNDNLH